MILNNENMNITRYVFQHVLTQNRSICKYTYSDLLSLKNQYVGKLQNLRPNDRVILCGPKSIHYVALLCAIWEKRSIAIPVHQISDLIVKQSQPNVIWNHHTWIHHSDKKPMIDSNNIATILYSSGTTGHPKGILLSHENIIQNLEMIQNSFHQQISATDSSFSILPWHHCYGLVCELLFLLCNNANVMIPTDSSHPKHMMNEIKWQNPTLLFTVPKMLETIKKKDIPWIPFSLKKRFLFGNRLRMMSVGGSSCDPHTLEFFLQNYGLDIYQGYGMTECGPMIALNSKEYNRLGSVGKPLEHVKIQFSSEQEIQVQSPSLMIGELDSIQKDQIRIKTIDSWFSTGDKGYMDRDGYLYIHGRLKSEFKLSNGKYINPVYLENKLLQSKWIEQVVLLPSSNQERVVALLYLNSSMIPPNQKTILDEITHILSACESYEIPKDIHYLKKPMTIENGLLSQKYEPKRNILMEKFYQKII